MVNCDLLHRELGTLEHHRSKDKVDRPTTSLIGLADTACDFFCGITRRREGLSNAGIVFQAEDGTTARPNPTRPEPPAPGRPVLRPRGREDAGGEAQNLGEPVYIFRSGGRPCVSDMGGRPARPGH
jgi:hypothetical protein